MFAPLLLTAALLTAAPGDAEPPPLAPAIATPGNGTFRPGALLQTWLVADDGPTSSCKALGGCANTYATFRVRRVQLEFNGDLMNGLFLYKASFDPVRALEFENKSVKVEGGNGGAVTVSQPNGPSSIMQDLFMTLQTSAADITVGQFRIPVSYEGFGSSAKLLFPERSLVSRAYGDRRDTGLKVAKTFTRIGYAVTVLNGSGQNRLDNELAKDFATRLEFYPVKGLLLGVVGYTTIGNRYTAARDRAELDVRYEAGPLLLQSEFIRARDRATHASTTHSGGFYVAGGFKVTPELQPIVRVGHNDPLLGAKGASTTPFGREVTFYEVGCNYYMAGDNAKLQFSLSSFQYERLLADTQGILGLQLSF